MRAGHIYRLRSVIIEASSTLAHARSLNSFGKDRGEWARINVRVLHGLVERKSGNRMSVRKFIRYCPRND